MFYSSKFSKRDESTRPIYKDDFDTNDPTVLHSARFQNRGQEEDNDEWLQHEIRQMTTSHYHYNNEEDFR